MPIPDPAASVLLLRPAAARFEVLMVERNARGFFGSLFVFPGGQVDLDDAPADFGVWDDASHRVAALRELAEETGILLTSAGRFDAPAAKGGLDDHLASAGHQLATGDLVMVSRWVTPESAPRRFDTRFFLAECDPDVVVRIDRDELVGHVWVTPEDALANQAAGSWRMMLPTIAHLRWLRRRGSIEEALAAAEGADGRTLIEPRVESDGSLLPIHLPVESS